MSRNYDSLDTFWRLGVMRGFSQSNEDVAALDGAMNILYECELEVQIRTPEMVLRHEGTALLTRIARRLGERFALSVIQESQ